MGQFSISVLGKGRFRFTRADGRVLPDAIDASTLIRTKTPLEAEHSNVAPDAATTRWTGERLDRHYAVAGLAAARTAELSLGTPDQRRSITTSHQRRRSSHANADRAAW
jgi:hypothetical protein